jgi:hypothetical protein
VLTDLALAAVLCGVDLLVSWWPVRSHTSGWDIPLYVAVGCWSPRPGSAVPRCSTW